MGLHDSIPRISRTIVGLHKNLATNKHEVLCATILGTVYGTQDTFLLCPVPHPSIHLQPCTGPIFHLLPIHLVKDQKPVVVDMLTRLIKVCLQQTRGISQGLEHFRTGWSLICHLFRTCTDRQRVQRANSDIFRCTHRLQNTESWLNKIDLLKPSKFSTR
jgi:hypothetical protein